MMTREQLEETVSKAIEDEDPDALGKLRRCFIATDQPVGAPFDARVAFNPRICEDALASAEGSIALGWANGIERARRNIRYRLRIALGYGGPRIVSEGDSWFQYPFILDDVIDNLCEDHGYAIRSLGGAGHLIQVMEKEGEYTDIIAKEDADVFLLSGGGNDLVADDNLASMLVAPTAASSAENFIETKGYKDFYQLISGTYRRIVGGLAANFPRLVIIGHGYDYALPKANGTWLGPQLAKRNVPERYWNGVIRILIDGFYEALGEVQQEFPEHFYVVPCRRQVGKNGWHDELHPKNPGYERVADLFAGVISAATQSAVARPSRLRVRPSAVRREEASAFREAVVDVPGATALASSEVRTASDSLAEWRARFTEEDLEAWRHYVELDRAFGEPEEEERLRTRRECLPADDNFALERLIGKSNLFRVNYLSRGNRAAAAVGKIAVRNRHGMTVASGTGFLVAPGLLLTNNHVLYSEEYIPYSHILFDYEYDVSGNLKDSVRFGLTGALFHTSDEYDFTFVSVEPVNEDGLDIRDQGHLNLIEATGKASKGEYVSILQHADGRPKQIAIRDSYVIGRRDKYIYYTTDTNPGSSGAPVVNDQWLPVALHHRTVPDYNKVKSFVANRGIRISEIFSALRKDAARSARATEVLSTLRSTGDGLAPRVELDAFTEIGVGMEEGLKEPYHDPINIPRSGYDPEFIGVEVPLPWVHSLNDVARRLDNHSHKLTYEHFTIVMQKTRRLALFSASNVDARPSMKEPEEGYAYGDDGLAGHSSAHKWFTDPRIPLENQLPDIFYTDDDRAFDKGHVVRRDAVAWGHTYRQVRRANGDTFHTTNCSPQTAGFNRARAVGKWQGLENMIFKLAMRTRVSVLAGPVLSKEDRSFEGRDYEGRVQLPIPSAFWKVIVWHTEGQTHSAGFLLEQDLSGVSLEAGVPDTWRPHMESIAEIERCAGFFEFPDIIHKHDENGSEFGEALRGSLDM